MYFIGPSSDSITQELIDITAGSVVVLVLMTVHRHIFSKAIFPEWDTGFSTRAYTLDQGRTKRFLFAMDVHENACDGASQLYVKVAGGDDRGRVPCRVEDISLEVNWTDLRKLLLDAIPHDHILPKLTSTSVSL